MGTLSIWHLVILALIVLLIFGRGRISALLGDVGRGIRAFRDEIHPYPPESSRDKDEPEIIPPPAKDKKSGIR